MNIYLFGYGITCGWTSSSLMILTSDESPLPTGKVNLEEASWIASLVNLGGSIGTLFFGVITNKFGRKKPLIVITVPTIVSHIIVFAPELLSNFQKLHAVFHSRSHGCLCFMRKMCITCMQPDF